MTALAYLVLALAALPAILVAVNILTLARTPRRTPSDGVLVSILIPARNEAANIGPAVEAALASRGVAVEVLVMDDGSTDATPGIVAGLAVRDPRVRPLQAPPLPAGWAGKMHACQRLGEAARGRYLLFVDADVRLLPDAAARMAGHAEATGASLVSGVPRQVTGTLGELLTVPMINMLMLGYLPMRIMRWKRTDPGLGAACGQLMLVEAGAYRAAGGHGPICTTWHDGIKLPRHLRREGYATDLLPGAELAACRMYEGFGQAWAGFSKNAHEGMATARALPVWTVLLLGGHVLPPILVGLAAFGLAPMAPAALAFALSVGARAAVTVFAREHPATILLHPATILVALTIQWGKLLRIGGGGRAGWKGRLHAAE
jgi:hypothetical protein